MQFNPSRLRVFELDLHEGMVYLHKRLFPLVKSSLKCWEPLI